MKEKTITVLMPTYNDEKYIPNAIGSLQKQSYGKWKLVIIDNGSEDNTPKVIERFMRDDSRISYLREERTGQLNALFRGASFVKGDFVTLLHSDDELADAKSFENNVSLLEEDEVDGIFCDLLTMDANGKNRKRLSTVDSIDRLSPSRLFLRGGSNMIPDIFFVKSKAFGDVLQNYIMWNMPYWLRMSQTEIDVMKLRKTEPWYKYRVYSENYMATEIGRFETANGCLRTVLELGQRLSFPFLTLQRTLVRIFKKRGTPLFRHNQSSAKHLRKMVEFVLDSYFVAKPKTYLSALRGFYSNFPSNRTIRLNIDENTEILLGKDARLFFNLMSEKSLPAVYEHVLKEAVNGFGRILVKSEDLCKKATNVVRLLNFISRVETE